MKSHMRTWTLSLSCIALAIAALPLSASAGSEVAAKLAEGDALYAKRADGHEDGVPRPEPIARGDARLAGLLARLLWSKYIQN